VKLFEWRGVELFWGGFVVMYDEYFPDKLIHPSYSVHMYIAVIPNRNSPPAILLRESYRQQGRVKNRTLANLSHWPPEKIEALRQVLKGTGSLSPQLSEACTVTRSRPYGHVAAVWGAIERLGLPALLDRPNSPQRSRALALLAAQSLEPGSELATARALNAETCRSSLGEPLQLENTDEDDPYAAMDWLRPRQGAIEAGLARRHLGEGTAEVGPDRGRHQAPPARAEELGADSLPGGPGAGRLEGGEILLLGDHLGRFPLSAPAGAHRPGCGAGRHLCDPDQRVGAATECGADSAHYKRQATVESVDLQVRPIRHRPPGRVRAHVLFCPLAYYVEWHMRRALAPVLFDHEQSDSSSGSPVTPTQRSPAAPAKALRKRTPDQLPVQSFADWLRDLATS